MGIPVGELASRYVRLKYCCWLQFGLHGHYFRFFFFIFIYHLVCSKFFPFILFLRRSSKHHTQVLVAHSWIRLTHLDQQKAMQTVTLAPSPEEGPSGRRQRSWWLQAPANAAWSGYPHLWPSRCVWAKPDFHTPRQFRQHLLTKNAFDYECWPWSSVLLYGLPVGHFCIWINPCWRSELARNLEPALVQVVPGHRQVSSSHPIYFAISCFYDVGRVVWTRSCGRMLAEFD